MKKLITSLALALTALSGYAITPLWMRDARISPNGTEIVKAIFTKSPHRVGQPFS